MRYRKLDPDGDYAFGNGLADFWIDQPEAVAQAALTRVEMFTGDWYAAPADGMPWRTMVLGKGKRLFGDGTLPRSLRHTGITTTPGGTVVIDYTLGGAVTTGSFAMETPTPEERARRERMASEAAGS